MSDAERTELIENIISLLDRLGLVKEEAAPHSRAAS